MPRNLLYDGGCNRALPYFASANAKGIACFHIDPETGAAQLAGGCPGIALQMDLAESQRLRREVLRLIELAAEGKSFGQVFAQKAQLAKSERERFENILELFYSIFHDMLELSHGPQEQALRNPDLKRELEALSQRSSLEWVQKAVGELDLLQGRLRRNINRQLGLDALAVSFGSR